MLHGRQKNVLSFYCFFALISLASCAQKPEDADRNSSVNTGLYYASALWPNGRASVCFVNNSDYPHATKELRAEIEKTVTEEISNVTRFRFEGFNLCSEGDADVKVYVQKNEGISYASRGNDGKARVNLAIGNGPDPKFEAAGSQFSVLHEFGHVLGLDHEQNRTDSTCDIGKAGNDRPPSIPVGKYDPDSVMNYCLTKGVGVLRKSLSRGDVETINTMYAKSNAGGNRGQRARCIKQDVTQCVKEHGGETCITNYCNGGEYVCSNASLLRACAKGKGGVGCFAESRGNCKDL
jgi:hypothetical protein